MKLFHLCLILCFLSLPLSCAVGKESSADASALQPVTLQLKWQHAFQFAGFYAADLKGFYRDAGLAVTIRERHRHNPHHELVGKDIDFALANGAEVIAGFSRGEPVKVLAVIFQHSANILLSRRDRGIRSPADLVGRRVMLTGSPGSVEFEAMMLHEGVDPSSLDRVKLKWDFTDLIKGRVDAMASYLTTGPYQLRRMGVEPAVLRPIEYGVDFYGDTLITPAKILEQNPEQTRAFVQASLKGWEYAFAHQDEIIDYILTLPGVRQRGITADGLRHEAEVMEELIQPRLVELGHVNPGRFRHMADVLARLGLMEPGQSLDDLFVTPGDSSGKTWIYLLLGVLGGGLGIGLVTWLINRRLAALVEARTRESELSEQRFHDLVNLLPEMIWETNAEGRLVFFNPAGLKLLGYEADVVEKGIYPLDLIAPEDRDRARKNIQDILQGKPGRLNEYKLLASDGSRIPVLIRSARIVDKGKPRGLRGIIIDVSERKQLEEQLRQAQKMEALGTMAGGIAHDFNNILTGILGYIELAAMHVEANSRAHADLDHARKGALRARDLVAQILSFSRKSEKKVSLIDPAEVVSEAVRLLRSTTPSPIEIQFNVRSRSRVKADVTQLHQVVMNICTNAIQAMDSDKGTLTLSLWDEWLDAVESRDGDKSAGGPYLCIQIHDTGQGIEPQILDRIFDPYFTTKEQGKGTGLGLSVVHGIVREYGGRIKVFSEQGRGTTFLIYLPAADAGAGEGEFTPALYDAQATEKQEKAATILIVDDEEELVRLLGDYFNQAGFTTIGCRSGSEVMDYIADSKRPLDLALIDMTVTGGSGLDLGRELLKQRPGLPIILMTGGDTPLDRQEVRDSGISELVGKPLEMHSLLQTVHHLLRNSEEGSEKEG